MRSRRSGGRGGPGAAGTHAAEVGAPGAVGLGFGSRTPLGAASRGHIPRRLENAANVNVPCSERSLVAASRATVRPPESTKCSAPPAPPRAF